MHKWAVKVNDVSHNYNFKEKFNLYNAIIPLDAVILFRMLRFCILGIQLADYIRNLNN